MSPADGTHEPLAGRRVLVVEDDALIAMELEDLLAGRGAIVVGPVPSVQRALRAIDAMRPEVAVLDVNLRGTRSTPIAERLRAEGVPFVLVTGYSRSQLDEPALREAPIVPKPVDRERLIQELLRLLPARHC